MSNAEKDSIGDRVSLYYGGCAWMSYVKEYKKVYFQVLKVNFF